MARGQPSRDYRTHNFNNCISIIILYLCRAMGLISTVKKSIMKVNGMLISAVGGGGCIMLTDPSTRESGTVTIEMEGVSLSF